MTDDTSTPLPETAHRRLRVLAISATALAVLSAVGFTSLAHDANKPLFTLGASTATTQASRDMMLAPCFIGPDQPDDAPPICMGQATYTYRADGVSTTGGTARVFQIMLDANAQAKLEKLATALHVTGSIEQPDWSSPDYPVYRIGTDTTPSLTLNATGTGDWYYNDPASWNAMNGCSTSSQPGETSPKTPTAANEAADCNSTTTPSSSKLPGIAQAKKLARELFTTSGFPVSDDDITIDTNDMQVYATATLKVNGQPTALTWTASWGHDGALASASGHFIKIADRGTFPTISAASAVERISSGKWNGTPAGATGGAVTFATDAVATTLDTAPSSPALSPTPLPATQTSKDAAKADPSLPVAAPAPSPMPVIEVRIVDATQTLLTVWDAQGDAWLVPGYDLVDSNGAHYWIISLPDGVIALPDYSAIPMMARAETAKR